MNAFHRICYSQHLTFRQNKQDYMQLKIMSKNARVFIFIVLTAVLQIVRVFHSDMNISCLQQINDKIRLKSGLKLNLSFMKLRDKLYFKCFIQ